MRTHRIAPLAVTLLAIASCGDGGGAILTPPDDDDDPPAQGCTDDTPCGEIRIALTDADGDFLSYTVDLVSIRLERANGDRVEALSDRQRVDFASLADVSELIAATDIPNGTYERAIVRLDYEEAEVTVEVDGIPTVAQVVDPSGDALGEVDVEIVFDKADPLVIGTNNPALLQLDFDLDASHEVNLGTTPATVTAAPFLVASLEPFDGREFRVRGQLDSVSPAQGRYVVDLRPFYNRTGRNGRFRVETTADTACEVNGNELDVTVCLTRLADLPQDTLTAAQGSYDADADIFTATRVLAGSSVPGFRFDTIIGTVAARNLNELVVQGATLVRQDGEAVYAEGDIEIQLDSGTEVTQDGGTATPLDIDAVSVGQRIHAFGEASSSDFDPTFDATSGRVRLYPTRLTGFVAGTATRELRLELVSIDGRDPQFFDFDGTGSSSLTTADPQDYEIDTGNLDLGEFDVDEGAEAFGFVAPFRSAPPDFEATAITDLDQLRALLGVGWGFNGTESPFLDAGSNGITIDVTNIDLSNRQFLEIGPRRFDITSDLPAAIRVEPVDEGVQRYAIAQGLEVELFSDFGDFVGRVNGLLGGGADMRSFTARGIFDEDTTTVSADYVAVQFAP
jgi:hypothetical protein